ncbi:integrase domain-containing protein [Vibrio breoganii]
MSNEQHEKPTMKQLYKGHLPKGVRDFNKPNFGLGARQIDRALINASLEQLGGVKNNTHQARLPACRDFARFLKEETEVRRLNQVNKSHVSLYGEYLRGRFESDESFAPSSARDYLSHVNVCLAQARGDDKLKVGATRDLDYPPKTGIATVDRSTPIAQHQRIVAEVSEEVGIAVSIQRHLGLRQREASLFDCDKALAEYHRIGKVTISRGTKGGQDRSLEIEDKAQVHALELGQQLQAKTGHDNLVPEGESFKAFQSRAWREVTAIDPTYHSHGERKFFAIDFYTRKAGVEPPVVAGVEHGKAHHKHMAEKLGVSIEEAKKVDKEVRLALSRLLGHHRVGITNNYIG